MIVMVFVVGMFVGAILGVIGCCLCVAAKRGDELAAWRKLPEDLDLRNGGGE